MLLRLLARNRKANLMKIKRTFAKETFLLPDLGEKIKEGQIKKLFVKVGSYVKEFDPVAEVATDKANADITSPYNGTITKIFRQEEDMCDVGEAFFEIETDADGDEKADTEKDDKTDSKSSPKEKQSIKSVNKVDEESDEIKIKSVNIKDSPEYDEIHKKNEGNHDDLDSVGNFSAKKDDEADHSNIKTTLESTKTLSTPAVRTLAKKLGLSIHEIQGSGKKGRILKEDVLNIDNIPKKGISHKDANKQPEKVLASKQPEKTSAVKQQEKGDEIRHTPEETGMFIKMSMFERGMVKSMTQAASIPHFNLHEEFDVTDLVTLREKLKESGSSVSLFAFIMKSFSLALLDQPKLNSTYYPDKDQFSYTINRTQNFSIAIDSANGLVAPNIKGVHSLSIQEIDKEVKNLKILANANKLTSEHLTGGTIALSNIGTLAGIFATPLNVPGQTCIVALGRVVIKPIFCPKQQTFIPRKILPLSFGCDHRVLDGATVAKFSLLWKQYVENPYFLVTKLK